MNVASTRTAPLIRAGLAAVLAVCAGAALAPDGVEGAHVAARDTARVGFILFVLVYVASSLVTLWSGELARTLLRQRRAWGLGFAFTYLGRLSDPKRFAQGAVLLPAARAALMLRVAAWWVRMVGPHAAHAASPCTATC